MGNYNTRNILQERAQRLPDNLILPRNIFNTDTSARNLEGGINLGEWIENKIAEGNINAGGGPEDDLAGIMIVDPGGNDTTGNGSPDEPFATPWGALHSLDTVDNDIIMVMPGTYTMTDGIASGLPNFGNLAEKDVIYYLMPGAEIVDATTTNTVLFNVVEAGRKIRITGEGTITKTVDVSGTGLFRAVGTDGSLDVKAKRLYSATQLVVSTNFTTVNIDVDEFENDDQIGILLYGTVTTEINININKGKNQLNAVTDSGWELIRLGTSGNELDGVSCNININTFESKAAVPLGSAVNVGGIIGTSVRSNVNINIGTFDIQLPGQALQGEMNVTWDSEFANITPATGFDVSNTSYLVGFFNVLTNTDINLNVGSGKTVSRFLNFGGTFTKSNITVNSGIVTTSSQSIYYGNVTLAQDTNIWLNCNIVSAYECIAVPANANASIGKVWISGNYFVTEDVGGAVVRIEDEDHVAFVNAILKTSIGANSFDADATGPFAVTIHNVVANVDSSAKVTTTGLTVTSSIL